MTTVVIPHNGVGAIVELGLGSCAANIVKPDLATALPKVGAAVGRTATQAELSADHLGISVVPAVVADCAPLTPIEQLDAPLVRCCPTYQPCPCSTGCGSR